MSEWWESKQFTKWFWDYAYANRTGIAQKYDVADGIIPSYGGIGIDADQYTEADDLIEPYEDLDGSPLAEMKWMSYSKPILRSRRRRGQIADKQVWSGTRRATALGIMSDLTTAQWRIILDGHSRRCVYCGAEFSCMDHVIPISRGGCHTAENVVPSCTPCNSDKSDKMLDEWIPDPERLNEVKERLISVYVDTAKALFAESV